MPGHVLPEGQKNAFIEAGSSFGLSVPYFFPRLSRVRQRLTRVCGDVLLSWQMPSWFLFHPRRIVKVNFTIARRDCARPFADRSALAWIS